MTPGIAGSQNADEAGVPYHGQQASASGVSSVENAISASFLKKKLNDGGAQTMIVGAIMLAFIWAVCYAAGAALVVSLVSWIAYVVFWGVVGLLVVGVIVKTFE